MIRYSVSDADIRAAIEGVNATWLDRAAERTAAFIAAGSYDETSSIWSEIKPVYIALQNNKCIFCERKFESPEFGKIEYDLEHFRPKSSIKTWPRADDDFSYDFDTGDAADQGYFWLAYETLNYAASCKVCNSTLKSNYFPIAGDRGMATATPEDLLSEKPFLCYPVSDFDEDPQNLVTFSATIAVPAAADGHDRRRGEVIIDFFRLNRREQLHRERAQMIMILGDALRRIEAGEDVALNTQIAEKVISEEMRHAACSRAFRSLWDADRDLARRYHDRCKQYFVGLIEASDIV